MKAKYYIDVTLVEKVQRRATKCVPGLKELNYEERLKSMNLPSLSYRRKRGDLIEAYKLTHGYYSTNKNLLILDKTNRTRGHSYKVEKQRCNTSMRQHFFANRVVNQWNSLPASVVEAPSLNSFKTRLDKHFINEMFRE